MRMDDEEEDKPEEVERGKQDEPLFMGVAKALYKSRTILIFGDIDVKLAERTTAHMLALAAEGEDPIRIIINSPGGHVEAGDTICDMIRFVKPKVKVLGSGWVASMGAQIFLSAKRENRFSLPTTRYMLHQPLGGVGGRASDIEIEAKEIIKMRERINKSIAEATGQPLARITKDTDRNFWMGPQEAKDYGIVGHVITSAGEF
jgi:ATP-dependent Clp protease protease subunit